jgi:hypothetical protein
VSTYVCCYKSLHLGKVSWHQAPPARGKKMTRLYAWPWHIILLPSSNEPNSSSCSAFSSHLRLLVHITLYKTAHVIDLYKYNIHPKTWSTYILLVQTKWPLNENCKHIACKLTNLVFNMQVKLRFLTKTTILWWIN